MHLWGLHVVDLGIIVLFLLVVVWLGRRVRVRSTNLDDFYLAGRKLGKAYQFFLNFGSSTNASQAVAVSREVYRQGIGGMWIQSLVLFLTPFYWFTVLFFRRVRLTTIGDYFTERFQSPFLGAAYAVFTLALSALVGGGIGMLIAGKTMVAMTPKAIEQCTPAERASIMEFRELKQLESVDAEALTPQTAARREVLRQKQQRGELRSFVSHIDERWFFVIYALVVGAYTMMGGFRAAAVTDAVEGLLIVVFSVLLVPVGLSRLGGFAGLHAAVPSHLFELFGSAALSEYAWYTVLAMVLANLVSIVAVVSGMQTAGSATDEFTARVGMIGGMFAKRVLMIFWALAGLIAVGLLGSSLSDPDLIWGVMTNQLLGTGAVGLMLVGVLAANMSSLGAAAVSHSALFIRNLYAPFAPARSDAHYMLVGRLVIAGTLAGAIVVAMAADNLLELFQYIISAPAIFGASIWLGFMWRRVTKWAVIVQVVVCLLIYAVIPTVFQGWDAARRHAAFLIETAPRTVLVDVRAASADVAAGLAARVGDSFTRRQVMLPVGILFERVVSTDPDDPESPREGRGRFHAELWVMQAAGVSFTRWSKPQLVAARFFFDALFPFVLLFLVSWVTPRAPREALDRFFAKLHTPVQPTPEAEQAALAASYADPRRFDHDLLFPGTEWEILRPARSDYIGFFGTWVLVGLVVLMLWAVVNLR
jgi:solute:Na+ symporter, SSS family